MLQFLWLVKMPVCLLTSPNFYNPLAELIFLPFFFFFFFESISPLVSSDSKIKQQQGRVERGGRIRFTITVLIAAKINILYINLTRIEHLPLGQNRSFLCHLQGHNWCDSVLGQVIVYLRIALVSLKVIPVDKAFYPFLQISWLYRKLQLFTTYNFFFININIHPFTAWKFQNWASHFSHPVHLSN